MLPYPTVQNTIISIDMIPKYQNLKTLYQWVKTRMIGKSEQYRKVRIVRMFELKLGNILTVLVNSVVLIMIE